MSPTLVPVVRVPPESSQDVMSHGWLYGASRESFADAGVLKMADSSCLVEPFADWSAGGPSPARVCVQEINGYQRPLDIGEVPPLFARVGMATGDIAVGSRSSRLRHGRMVARGSTSQVRLELVLGA
ncbi:unnamed protein product [Ixodes hexagonus]